MKSRNSGKRLLKKPKAQLKPVYAAILVAFTAQTAQANPTGGVVVNGSATFVTTGNTLTVTNTPGTIINWQGFSIGSSEITNFAQQSASSTVLNRVVSSNPSSILGTLQSNGRVFLINPNGIVFGAGATVDVAGLVASTLNISNEDFLAGRYHFTDVTGTAQNLSNAGNITAHDGGQIYLIAPNVENTGIITAPNGQILLAAGYSVDLVNTDSPNVIVNITAPAGDATNVGQLVASAGSLGLYGVVVRNSGTVSADSATMEGGKIVFRASQRVDAGGTISAQGVGGGQISIEADMQTGTVNVTGTLDASAPISGDGGFIDTSAAHVQIADTARITTSAANGTSGTWLIDPVDFTIASSGGDITGAQLSSELATTNVTILSTSGATGTNGDVNVNDVVSWTANKLTLNAQNNINVNANLNGSGTASLELDYGQGALAAKNSSNYYLNNGAQINLSAGYNFSTKLGSDGAVVNYYVITSLGAAGSTTGTDLQGINGNLSGNYALGSNVDASATSAWNGGAGFTPIGNGITPFMGSFDGLGHTVSNLTINLPTQLSVGLFGNLGAGSIVSNIGLVNSSVNGGSYYVGGLAGYNEGNISNSYVSGSSVAAVTSSVGGLVGINTGSIINSYVTGGTVSGKISVGGFVGFNYGTITGSHASTVGVVGVTGGLSNIGGLVGYNAGGGASISNSYVDGGSVSATAANSVGGLVGYNNLGSISNSNAENVSVAGAWNVGGLVGVNYGGVSQSYVSGATVSGGSDIGGLVGYNASGYSISGSYVSGSSVTASVGDTNADAGGLVGYNAGSVSTSYASDVNVGGSGWYSTNFGGLVGENATSGSINNTYVIDGNVKGNASNGGEVGGLVGYNAGSVSNSYASNGSLSGGGIGGAVGENWYGYVSNVFWNTQTTTVGVGNNTGILTNVQGLTTAQLMSQSTLISAGFDFGTTWWMSDGNTLPFLQSEWSTTISNSHQLQLMAMNLSASYTLANNIDMSETSSGTGMWGSAGFVPVGDSSYNYFWGQFNGQNFTISNLNINRPSTSYVGLFGYVGSGASVINVGLVNANVAGMSSVGALAGYNQGSITNSYVSSGNVSGSYNIGGLAGANDGALVNSHYDIGSVSINGANTVVTAGGLYNDVHNINGLGQFDDWLTHGLTLNIANYSTLPGSGGSYTVNGVQGMKDLLGFADNPAYTFTLSGNIDLSALPGFNVPFLAANFDGANNTISNLNVALPNDNLGLFGHVAQGATVSNVVLSNATVTGNNDVGALVGWNEGNVSHSSSSLGTVNGASDVGGLVGHNQASYTGPSTARILVGGSISNSYVGNGSVIGSNNVGGLVGLSNGGSISDSSVDTVNVSGVSRVGGLLGGDGSGSGGILEGGGEFPIMTYVPSGGSGVVAISNSHVSNSTISGSGEYIGGLAGVSAGTITGSSVDSSAVSSSGTGYVSLGGLVGLNSGSVVNSYVNSGSVKAVAGSSVGGLVGYNTGSIDGSYVTAGTVTGAKYVGGLAGGNYGSLGGGGVISNSYVNDGIVNGNIVHSSVTGGTGVGGLVGYNNAGSISTSHVSNANVAGTGASANSIGGLVGYSSGSVSGSFVGGGTVMGISEIGGLVGTNAGSIDGSYAGNVNVTGSGYDVGGLVGLNQGGVGGNGAVGYSPSSNLVGATGNAATITNSYVSGGTVSGASNVGGLVGRNVGGNGGDGAGTSYTLNYVGAGGAGGAATISNSYVSGGTISGGTNIGGLVGSNSAGSTGSPGTGPKYAPGGAGGAASVSNSYVNGGSVTGTTYVGGVAGFNDLTNGSTVSGAFWDAALAAGNLTNGIGYDNSVHGATDSGAISLTAPGMMTMANFSQAGWNISNTGGAGTVWRIYDGSTTPLLASFLTPLTITANNATKTYDGMAYSGGNGVTTSVAGAALLGTPVYGGTSQGAINAGSYTISVSGFYSNQQGYDISYVGGSVFTITPAVLSVYADPESKVVGTVDPLLAYTVAGLKLNDTEATVLNGGSLSRDPGETIGTYQINQGSLALASTNYTLKYYPGTFCIVAPTVINEITNATLLLGTPETGSAQSTSSATGSSDDGRRPQPSSDDKTADAGNGALPLCK